MTEVREVADDLRESWDAFVAASPLGSFLQSWAWGEFQREAGFRITRLAAFATENTASGGGATNSLAAVCLIVQRPLPLGRDYLTVPWGPVLREVLDTRAFEALLASLRARATGPTVFVHLEPRFPPTAETRARLGSAGLQLDARCIQPKDTLVADLTLSEDDLLRGMHPKTRYNIRVARRRGVTVAEETTPEGLAVFLRLAHEVEERGRFHYHPHAYYRAMLRTLAPRGMLHILVARRAGEPLAAHLLVRFGDTVTYAHGASARVRRSLMAPVLLQWEGMRSAKVAGARRYDFFGIKPETSHQLPVPRYGKGGAGDWSGLTRFKRGFGGREEHFIGGADLVGDPVAHRLVELGRLARRFLR